MGIVEITTDNFDEIVVAADKPVVVDFWASWCGPCKMLSPIIDQIAEEREDIIVGKVNVDEQPLLAMQFGISGVPTVALFKNGDVVERSVGFATKAEIIEELGL